MQSNDIQYYFKASNAAFYNYEVDGSVPITMDQYIAFSGCFIDKCVSADENGQPILIDIPVNLPALKEKKSDYLKQMASAQITGGYVCDVLGSNFTYPTEPKDQANLNVLNTASNIFGAAEEPYVFWCADESGVWGRHGHTTAQIQAVGIGVLRKVKSAQDHYESKLSELSAAETIEDINAITW
jgi:hypothetical protein